jgi:hypothetical protein
MSAKEKAEELINKMLEDFVYFASKEIAKRHALIAVEEVLGYMGADRGTEFWQEVKSELKKL